MDKDTKAWVGMPSLQENVAEGWGAMTTPEDQAATIAELRERLQRMVENDVRYQDLTAELEGRATAAERTAIKRERQLADLETQNEAVRRALQQALKLAKEYGYDNFLGALAEFGWWKQAMDALGAPSPTIDATAAERALVERGAQVADLKEAWTVARKTLPPDRNLNAPWSQAIAIMDEAVDALPAPSPSRVAALVEAAKACANHPTMRAYPRTDEETLLIEAVDALEGA